MTPQQFVQKWSQITLKEISVAQSHFHDVCALIGHATPLEADPHGDFFTFEATVQKSGGGGGRADVWNKGNSSGNTKAHTPTWTKPTSSFCFTGNHSATHPC